MKSIGGKLRNGLNQVQTAAEQALDTAQDAAQDGYEMAAVKAKASVDSAKDKAATELNRVLENKIDRVLDRQLKPKVKAGLVDPYMPGPIKRATEAAVDVVWDDLKEEFWDAYQEKIFRLDPVDQGEPIKWCPTFPQKLRAYILWCLSPSDRNFWRQARNPIFWLLTIAKAIPYFGINAIAFVLLFLLKDKRDEYQLVATIMEVKGFQFVSMGLISAITGFSQYYRCVNLAGLNLEHTCHADGPGSWPGFYFSTVTGFFVPTLIAWVSFIALRWSKRKGERTLANRPARRHSREQKPGGYLRPLIFWDIVVMAVCLGLLYYLMDTQPYGFFWSASDEQWAQHSWKFNADLFWLKIMYAFLMFPFMLFALPLVSKVFLHLRRTGYNKNGMCVPFELEDLTGESLVF